MHSERTMGSDSSAEVDDRRKGSTDFTGCYRLTKTNHLDAYLRVCFSTYTLIFACSFVKVSIWTPWI